jgi:aminoglycoside phosphotransferase family enzyme/predicted kinase
MRIRIGENDQQATIAFLMRPEAYGLPGPVERIDTHAAIVFLAGDRAYKLKRAVRYSYLDFSTIAKRKAVCEAELALNQRTAAELYLEVRSINRLADGTLSFDEGEAIDWLVVMRRFAADSLLEAVALQGRLDAPLVRELADQIASFHDDAEVEKGDGAERVGRVIEGNRATMATLPPASLPPRECSDLHARSIEEWSRLAPLLDQRAAAGHVRHCHGDLHLANICLWRGKPTLFDCLEFDAALATTDVLYDLAFLVMDLWERGFSSQASLLFNRYLDMRDEAEGLAAFPLFLSMRCAIRAHVSATAAGRQTSDKARRAKLGMAREYLRAAHRFLDHPAPRLVAIGGLSGSGKSTLAGALAARIGGAPGARWLRTDVLRKRLASVAPETKLPQDAYSRENNATVYAVLLESAARTLATGYSVIVDGVFADPAERAKIAAVAKAAGVGFTGVWLAASPATLLDRVATRIGDPSDADHQVVERQLDYDLGDLGDWLKVNAECAPDAILARTLNGISEATAGRSKGGVTSGIPGSGSSSSGTGGSISGGSRNGCSSGSEPGGASGGD